MPDCHWLLKTPFKWLSLTGHALSLSWLLIADPARLAQDWSASRDGFRSSSRRLLAALPRMGSAWCCFWRERGRWEIRSIFSSSRPWEWGGPWWTDRCYEKTQFEKEANVQVRGQTLAEVETTSKCTGNDRTWGFVAFNAFQTYQASQEAQWHCQTSQKKQPRSLTTSTSPKDAANADGNRDANHATGEDVTNLVMQLARMILARASMVMMMSMKNIFRERLELQFGKFIVIVGWQ